MRSTVCSRRATRQKWSSASALPRPCRPRRGAQSRRVTRCGSTTTTGMVGSLAPKRASTGSHQCRAAILRIATRVTATATGWFAKRSSRSLANELRVIARLGPVLVSGESIIQQAGAFLVRVAPLLEADRYSHGATPPLRGSSPSSDNAPGSRRGLRSCNEPVCTREWCELPIGYASITRSTWHSPSCCHR